MENRAHALAAGLVTLLLGAALAAVALWFGKDEVSLIPYVLTTSRPVTGLKVEAPVRYRGVDVGKVDEISIDAGNGGRVQIRIGVRAGTPITSSTYAQLGYQGITGLAYVLLGDDGNSTYSLKSSPGAIAQIHMKPSLMDSGESLFGAFVEITEQVKRLLDDENQARVKRTLANLEEATQRVSAASKKLEPSLQAMPALIAETRALAGDARASVRKADQLIGSVNGLALKLDGRVDTLAAAVASVDASVGEVGTAARAVGEETMPRVNVLVDGLARDTHTLGRVINTLGEQPQSIVFGTAPATPGPGEPGFTGGK
jgi:phospholipid/cholesterol/gamma-HCH transport system substrate-binding protein